MPPKKQKAVIEEVKAVVEEVKDINKEVEGIVEALTAIKEASKEPEKPAKKPRKPRKPTEKQQKVEELKKEMPIPEKIVKISDEKLPGDRFKHKAQEIKYDKSSIASIRRGIRSRLGRIAKGASIEERKKLAADYIPKIGEMLNDLVMHQHKRDLLMGKDRKPELFKREAKKLYQNLAKIVELGELSVKRQRNEDMKALQATDEEIAQVAPLPNSEVNITQLVDGR